MARQRLGQHFLSDLDWREQIARAIRVSPNTPFFSEPETKNFCWIEIGAGHGEMTEHLAASGAPVIAVELDPPLAKRLQHLTQQFPNLSVHHADILKTDLRALAAGRRIRIYGNLPYYITSPILHHFFEFADLIDEIHIVIQLEVALRLVAQPGSRDYGYLSVFTQYFATPRISLNLPPSAFTPPPEVDSALVSMKLPGQKAALQIDEDEKFLDFVKLCFAQKRKTLANNLRTLGSPQTVRDRLTALDLRPTARAEELTLVQLAALYKNLG